MCCINLLYLCSSLMFLFLYTYLTCSVVCNLTLITMSQSINLGFNNVLEDLCDCRDYSNLKTVSKFNGLAVLQHNIRGVLGKQDQLRFLLSNIKNDCRVQVVLLAETWLNKNTLERVKIPGYSFVGCHRKCK